MGAVRSGAEADDDEPAEPVVALEKIAGLQQVEHGAFGVRAAPAHELTVAEATLVEAQAGVTERRKSAREGNRRAVRADPVQQPRIHEN